MTHSELDGDENAGDDEQPNGDRIPCKHDDGECVVCYDASKTHTLVPCGHRCVCQDCAEKIVPMFTRGPEESSRCPICRTPCIMVMKVYL